MTLATQLLSLFIVASAIDVQYAYACDGLPRYVEPFSFSPEYRIWLPSNPTLFLYNAGNLPIDVRSNGRPVHYTITATRDPDVKRMQVAFEMGQLEISVDSLTYYYWVARHVLPQHRQRGTYATMFPGDPAAG